MNIRDLTYIIAVDKYRAFGKAAENCYVSQPTLSGQIKKLELELGVTLFERSNKSVHTTQTGKEIVRLARNIIDQTEQIKSVADQAQDGLSGHVELGIIPTIAPYIIPFFVDKMNTEFPQLSAAYQENLTDNLNALLLNGELDAAIMATEPEDDKLASLPLYNEPFWLVVPKMHPLAKVKTLAMSDIPIDEVLLLTEGHCFRDQALSICRGPTRLLRQSIRATSLETLLNMVGAQQGLTLMPALAVGDRLLGRMDVKACPITGRGTARQVNLTYRKSFPRKHLIQALAKLIQGNLPKGVSRV